MGEVRRPGRVSKDRDISWRSYSARPENLLKEKSNSELRLAGKGAGPSSSE